MRKLKIALLALAAATVTARAQQLPSTTKLTDGVYAYEQVDPTKRGVSVGNLIVVTPEGVVVGDGQGTVDHTRGLVEAVARLTPQPIKYVVVGSIHGDHRGGDAAFPAGTTFIKEPRTLTLGGRTIEILRLGRAHTGSDLEVYLPAEKILYMSEVFSTRIFPSMANSQPSEWLAALTKAEAMNATTYFPAHAAIGATKDWTRDGVAAYHGALERVIAEGTRLHDAKVAVDEAPSRADFGPYASWARAADNAPGALKRVYMELDGQLK